MESASPLLGSTFTPELSPRPFDEKSRRQSSLEERGYPAMDEYRIWKIIASITYYIKFAMFALLPSPVQRRMRPGAFPQLAKAHSTAYLDGLRGLASLSVVLMHFTGRHESDYTEVYGFSRNKQMSKSIMQLPFIRVLFAGRGFVHVFFVVSGFALSLKPIRLARAHKYEELQGK